jgi:hypothetical protein
MVQTNALTRFVNAGELRSLQCEAEQMRKQIQTVLVTRFGHPNADGSYFTPAIAQAVTYAPGGVSMIHLSVVDVGTLHHVDKAKLMTQGVLDALAATVGYPVKPVTTLPGANGRPIEGLAYAVMLREPPRQPEPARLPKLARLSLASLSADQLQVPIGLMTEGPLIRALDEMGHTGWVGETQSGKSTGIHVALYALTRMNSPRRFQFAYVSPSSKQNEAAFWKNAPHRYCDIGIGSDAAIEVLSRVRDEIAHRSELFSQSRCRGLDRYNALHPGEPLPHLLLVVDETLEILGAGKPGRQAASILTNIVTSGGALGVRVWLVTQHVSTEGRGIPREIATNLSTMLGWHMHDEAAARQARCPGADRLPASLKGRLMTRVRQRPVQVQGYFISEDELSAVADQFELAEDKLLPVPACLSEDERALALYARDHLRGKFVISALATSFKGRISQRRIEDISRNWEAERGWLIAGATRAESKSLSDAVLALIAEQDSRGARSDAPPTNIIAFPAARATAVEV